VTTDGFTRAPLSSIRPCSVFQRLQGSRWATLVFRTGVGSVNGWRNASVGLASDPGLDEPSEAVTRAQRAGNIGIRVEAREDGGGVPVAIGRADARTRCGEHRRRVRELSGRIDDITEFARGLVPRKSNEIAVLTRPMMEIMLQLGYGIDLPAACAAGQRALPRQMRAGDDQAQPPVSIRSGVHEPADARTACRS
jgi:hypothetical protein